MAGEEEEPEYLLRARELARQLKIPHHSLDIRSRFKEQIINNFTDEYLHGRTPHPCVRCNNLIKWPILTEEADRLDCHFIASGHYVEIKERNGICYIAQWVDPDKDQSFFLWGLPQPILRRALFPLGNYLKTEVRRLAEERNFSDVARTKDSMGICFLPKDYRPFLKEELRKRNVTIPTGNYLDEEGKVIGTHPGFPYFTLGQRRGLGLTINKSLYVTALNPQTNTVGLGDREKLLVNRILLSGYHFSDPERCESKQFTVKIRYRKQATYGKVKLLDANQLLVELEEPVIGEANGQTATFYLGDLVAGGGWIEKSWLE